MDDAEAANLDAIEALTTLGQRLIAAILVRESLENVKSLIDVGAPLWYQDEEEGMSPLHAAAYVESSGIIKLLIAEGAIWNAVDSLGYTAGDVSLSLNDAESYGIIRDAGLRSELLLTLLSSKTSSADTPSDIVLRSTDKSAMASTDAFLSSKLRYTTDAHGQEICMLAVGDVEVGVMMGWEKGIMQETVEKLCTGHENFEEGLKVLNVGFGLGIIDSLFQSLSTPPAQHFIIEPHPDVLRHMKEQGWDKKLGITILEGKWQDYMESEEILAVGGFDIVYTDTFSEDYGALHQFFEHLPDILAGPESRFSFFNGLGATNALFYDVYTNLSEMHLSEIGIEVEWCDVDVTAEEGEDRWGHTREYFGMPLFRLPIAKMRAM